MSVTSPLRAVEQQTNQPRPHLHKRNLQAMRGPLTRITNRIAHGERPASECVPWKRHRYPLALMIHDVDHFKLVDDKLVTAVKNLLRYCTSTRVSKSLLWPKNSAEQSSHVIFIIDRNESQSGFPVDMQLTGEEASGEVSRRAETAL
jgi:hypothetical protein